MSISQMFTGTRYVIATDLILSMRRKHGLGTKPTHSGLQGPEEGVRATFLFPDAGMRKAWLESVGFPFGVGEEHNDILVQMHGMGVWPAHKVFELVLSEDFRVRMDVLPPVHMLNIDPLNLAQTMAHTEGQGGRATHVVMHPSSFAFVRCMTSFFDPETRRSEVVQGKMGHVFGAQVLVSHLLPRDSVYTLNLQEVSMGNVPSQHEMARIKVVHTSER